MVTQPFRFPGSAGQTLSGRMELPGGRVRGWAIFAHCFTCGKDNRAAVRIARLLAREGIGVLRFDFAGLGEHLRRAATELEVRELCELSCTLNQFRRSREALAWRLGDIDRTMAH